MSFERWLVSWHIELSQQLLFTLHASHQTTNYPETTKPALTQTHLKQKIHKRQTQNFRRSSPFGIASVKKKKKKST